MVLDVHRGLVGAGGTGVPPVARGAVKRIRVVAVPAKTQPEMNSPNLGLTSEDPGKLVLGTAPVEADGSAHFRVPAGVNVFFQALDADGMALQTMRTITYAQPGQTLACIGCHEHRGEAPHNVLATALTREPSKLTPGPDGSWPLRFDKLVQPVLDANCVKCHSPAGKPEAAKKLVLTAPGAYDALVKLGTLQIGGLVSRDYSGGYSQPGFGIARSSPLLAMLRKGHNDVKLDAASLDRLITWLDTYAQRQGHFSPEQERDLEQLRQRSAPLLAERP
jgi:mono/diheme cytochrome c family protein